MKKENVLKTMIALTMIAPVLTGCGKTLNVKDEVNVEYGNAISTNVVDYLSEDIKNEDKEKIIANTKVEILEDKKTEGKEYQSLGEYTVKLTYEDEVSEVKVIVKDTVKPVFKDFKNSVDTYKDVKVDFTKLYKAEDLDKVTITADDSKVDYTKEGSYKATVTATDESNNAETKEVTVNVKKPEIKLDKTSKSVYVKESFVLKTDIKGKDTKATFKSSDSTVATVSETGKVTAKKKGTATITATANGIEAKCKVTVKEVPKGSSTTTKVVTNPTTGKKEEVTVVKPSMPSGGSSTSKTPQTSREAFNLINAERQKAGLPALAWDSSMESLAKTRAKEITTKYSHVRPDGSFAPSNGEIIANRPTASMAVNAWMNSRGHRNIILHKEVTKCVVARCGEYWVGLFWR